MKIQTGKGTIPLLVLVAIWSISAVTSLPGLAVSPILGELQNIFPHVTQIEIQMLSSIPSLLIIPFVLLSGKLAVRKNKLKILTVGLSIFFVSGILCFFAKSIVLLILISAMIGVGAGMVIPFSTGLIADFFTGEYRVKQLGISSGINNGTLVIATIVAGYLAKIDWHLPFLVYTISGISLILIQFLKRSTPAQQVVTQDVKSGVIDYRKLAGLMILYFFITYEVVVILFNLPFVMTSFKMSSALSGWVISLFFLAIMLPGFFINKIIMRLRENLNLIAMGCITFGLLLIYVWHHEWLFIVGALVTGVGYGIMQPILYDKAVSISSADRATLALALVMSVNYVSITLASYITDGISNMFGEGSNMKFPFLINIILGALAIAMMYYRRGDFVLGMDKSYYQKAPKVS